jgi:hypothetical protein
MFNFDNASLQITKDEILKYITELQILERYCSNYKSLDSSFKSEFYSDKNGSCRIIISASGIPYYKDYGNGDYFLAFDYVSRKYGSNYHETCNIIANDFGLKRTNLSVTPQLLLVNDTPKPVKIKSNIQVIVKPFSLIDYEYWMQYGISLQTLQFFNVKACSHVYLNKGDKHYVFEYKNSNPLYSYKFFKNNTEYLKIYNPYSITKEGKWLSNVGSDCLQGYDQLKNSGELLILTKSMKDVLCLYEMEYNSVAVQAETNDLSKKSYEELSKRFNRIISLYDNDEAGRNGAQKLLEKYNILPIFIPEITGCKDISDFIKSKGLEKTKKLIIKLINERRLETNRQL